MRGHAFLVLVAVLLFAGGGAQDYAITKKEWRSQIAQ